MGDGKMTKPQRRCMVCYPRGGNVKSILLKHSKFSGCSKRAVGIFDCGSEVGLHERGDISKISILVIFGVRHFRWRKY